MPTIAYMSCKRKRVPATNEKNSPKELRDVYERIKVTIKDVTEIAHISARKDFVRFCCGTLTIHELVHRCKEEGRGDWYV